MIDTDEAGGVPLPLTHYYRPCPPRKIDGFNTLRPCAVLAEPEGGSVMIRPAGWTVGARRIPDYDLYRADQVEVTQGRGRTIVRLKTPPLVQTEGESHAA